MKDTTNKIAIEHKELHTSVSKIGKAIDRVCHNVMIHQPLYLCYTVNMYFDNAAMKLVLHAIMFNKTSKLFVVHSLFKDLAICTNIARYLDIEK